VPLALRQCSKARRRAREGHDLAVDGELLDWFGLERGGDLGVAAVE